jgi:2'-5' RNA ligase
MVAFHAPTLFQSGQQGYSAGMHEHRLFFALWPDDAEREAMAAAARRLFPLSGRPVAAADLHVTLAFVGGVDVARVAKFLALEHTLPAIPLAFDALEHWTKPRVLVAAASQTPAALQRAVDGLWHRLDRLGIARETRPFRPHVTLARDVRQPRNAAWPPVCWHARSVRLIESRPNNEPRYAPVRTD